MDQSSLPVVPDPTVFPRVVRAPFIAGTLPFVALFVPFVLGSRLSA